MTDFVRHHRMAVEDVTFRVVVVKNEDGEEHTYVHIGYEDGKVTVETTSYQGGFFGFGDLQK